MKEDPRTIGARMAPAKKKTKQANGADPKGYSKVKVPMRVKQVGRRHGHRVGYTIPGKTY